MRRNNNENQIEHFGLIFTIAMTVYGAALSQDALEPLTIDRFEFVELPQTGSSNTLQLEITSNIFSTFRIHFDCGGPIHLSRAPDSTISVTLGLGESSQLSVPVQFTGGSSSRISVSIVPESAPAGYIKHMWRSLTLVPESAPTGAKVGVYFDENATISCLPDSLNFPVVVPAYLMVTDYSENSGISAWEGRFQWSSNLHINMISVEGAGMNLAAWPDIAYGYSTPRPVIDTFLLATLSVVALGPGEISFTGADLSDPGGWPVFTTEGSNELIRFKYVFGGIDEYVASIGQVECPEVCEDDYYNIYDS